MKKKGTLPKAFEGMLKKLKRLDDELGISLRPYGDKKEAWERAKRKERETLLERIWENWPRKMLLSKEVLQMRGNALKNPEVKAVLQKTDTRIEDCALVDFWKENHMGKENDCPGHCSPEGIKMNFITKWTWGNNWKASYHYYWGGPKDSIKILFQQSANNRFKVVGVIQMFAEKEKKAA